MNRHAKRSSAALITLGSALMLSGCPASQPGTISNEIADDLSFVADSDAVYLTHAVNAYGLSRVGMDGSGRQDLYDERYRLEGAAFFAELRALSDDETNLFILRGAGNEPERIEALDKRVSAVAVHPDGTQIAVGRHADFDLPSSQQVDDDRIFLIDINDAGSAVPIVINELGPEGDESLWRLGYSRDGASLYAESHSAIWRIDPGTGQREMLGNDAWPWDATYPDTTHRERCDSMAATLDVRAEEGIMLSFDDGRVEELVGIEGRVIEDGSTISRFGDATFSASCETVAFVFEDTAWVVDVQSKVVGRLG